MLLVPKLIDYKRLQFSAEEMITVEFEEYGIIRAVKVDDRWVFKGRNQMNRPARNHIDQVLSANRDSLYKGLEIGGERCPACKELMRLDICIICDDKA